MLGQLYFYKTKTYSDAWALALGELTFLVSMESFPFSDNLFLFFAGLTCPAIWNEMISVTTFISAPNEATMAWKDGVDQYDHIGVSVSCESQYCPSYAIL